MFDIDIETAGAVVGALLTLLVLSYVMGDNPLYRLALHLFIGALVGYSFGCVVHELGGVVIDAWKEDPTGNLHLVVPVLMGVSLFVFKSTRRFAYVGNYFLAFLIGVGTAVALVGALQGTLRPQVVATGRALSLDTLDLEGYARGLLIVGGTVCTLLAFDFTFTERRRPGLMQALGQGIGALGRIGRWFLIVALGVAFAGALTASLSMLIERVQFLVEVVFGLGIF